MAASTVVEFETDSDSGYHDFKDGTHVVLDIMAPKTDGAAYAPPGTAKPAITKIDARQPRAAPAPRRCRPSPRPWPSCSHPSRNQTAGAGSQTGCPQAGGPCPEHKARSQNAESKAAEAKPETPAAQTAPAEIIPVADGKRTRDGAVITFKGAGGRASAVFVRGLTAWVVLENAPELRCPQSEASLGDFAAGLEAVSSNGLGILRITLKAPAEIGARGLGPNLEVEIAPKVAPPPVVIGFARNQSDPKRASLSTLLPAADHAFQLLDPSGGDLLTIIPGPGGPWRAFLAQLRRLRRPAQRQRAGDHALHRRSGDQCGYGARFHRAAAGLSLTPPQMPVAQTPSALARAGNGPSYMNFAEWGQASGGSFLATERKLTQIMTHVDPHRSNAARLAWRDFTWPTALAPKHWAC
jgi:hypothetical protein